MQQLGVRMTGFLSAAATTIFMATTGSGDPDTADRGLIWSIGPCLPGSENTGLSGCVNTANASTPCTESKGKNSVVNTFMRSPAMAIRTETMTIEATVGEEATTGKARNINTALFFGQVAAGSFLKRTHPVR